jgi:hypothetical protein
MESFRGDNSEGPEANRKIVHIDDWAHLIIVSMACFLAMHGIISFPGMLHPF